MTSRPGRGESGRPARRAVLALSAALLVLVACSDLEVPGVPSAPPPPSLTVSSPRNGDIITLTAQVAAAASSVNGVSHVDVLCGPLDAGARTVYSWAAPPYVSLVDFTQCQDVAQPNPDGGFPSLQLAVEAFSDAGATQVQALGVFFDTLGPTLAVQYPPTVQPRSAFTVVVSTTDQLRSLPQVALDGLAASSITGTQDGGTYLYTAVFQNTPGLGTDNYPYTPGVPVPIEVLTETERTARLTVTATALNGNSSNLDLGIDLTRVLWDRFIPGRLASSSPTSFAAEPVAFPGGLVLPFATSTPASSTSDWIPGLLTDADGVFFGFDTTQLPGGLDGGYLARGLNFEGDTLFSQFTGNFSNLLLFAPPGSSGPPVSASNGPPAVTPPLTRVDQLLCLQDSVTACGTGIVESLGCVDPSLKRVTVSSGLVSTGPPTVGEVAAGGGRYLSPNVGVCGSSWNLIDFGTSTVSLGPLQLPAGCTVQSISKLVPVGDGTFVVQLVSNCGAAAPLLKYPVVLVGAGSAILGSYIAPPANPSTIQATVVGATSDGRVVTLRNTPPYTTFELWSVGKTTPDVTSPIAGLYQTADGTDILARSTYTGADGSFAVFVSGAQLGMGVLAFGPDLRPLWLYAYPRIADPTTSRLVASIESAHVYVIDQVSQHAVSLGVAPPGSSTAAPTIKSFTATPATLPVDGGTVTLAWSVSGASALSISPGVGRVTPVTTGSKTVTVPTSTNFTLSATDPKGTSTASSAVCVASGPVALTASAPSSITTCGQTFQTTVTLVNGSCVPVTVSALTISSPVGACNLNGTYSNLDVTIPPSSTGTVLDLTNGTICCNSPPCSIACTDAPSWIATTDQGTISTTSNPVSLNIPSCDAGCP